MISEIVEVKYYNSSKLFTKLRNITMLQQKHIYPYELASMSIEKLNLDLLSPSQNYIIKDHLLQVEELKFKLKTYNIDIFNLNGYITMKIIKDKTPIKIDLLPIIVEEYILDNGQIAYIIADGMHRSYMAYLQSINPEIVFIRGIPKKLSYYAYPVKIDNWNLIPQFNHNLPADNSHIKKWRKYSKNENYKYYRNYNSKFNNCSKPKGGY